MRTPKKNMFVIIGAFLSILLLMVARHHPPSRRKIKEIWHGRVYWEGESNTTMLRSSVRVINTTVGTEITKKLDIIEKTALDKVSANKHRMTDARNVVFSVSDKLDIENTVQTQERLLYMLTHFTRIAEKYDIKYWLCAGTLIGAIRHHGFIPWDADIDISIPYDSYLKLQNAAEQELPSDLWLQDWQSDPLYKHGSRLPKIRDLNSDYTAWSANHKDWHNGIQLDLNIIRDNQKCFLKQCCNSIEEAFPLKRVPFEHITVLVPQKHTSILKKFYGNIDVPPVNKRIHHQGKASFKAPGWAKKKYPQLYNVQKSISSEIESKENYRREMQVMVSVLSRRSAFETRQVIRETWASGHNNVFFAVGVCCPIPPNDRKKWTCKRAKPTSVEEQSKWDMKCAKQDLKIAEEESKYKDIIRMPDIDVYRHLPQKVKFSYKWGLEHTTAKWFVKTDDDSVVRIDTLGSYLQKTYNSDEYVVVGRIANGWGVPRSGKWAENNYKPSKYPKFPLGSVGHVVSKGVATYIVDNSDKLFNYQGEDVSIGIWLNESLLKSEVKWVTSKHMANHGNCKDTGMWVMGHNIKPAKMRECFAHKDEIQEIVKLPSNSLKSTDKLKRTERYVYDCGYIKTPHSYNPNSDAFRKALFADFKYNPNRPPTSNDVLLASGQCSFDFKGTIIFFASEGGQLLVTNNPSVIYVGPSPNKNYEKTNNVKIKAKITSFHGAWNLIRGDWKEQIKRLQTRQPLSGNRFLAYIYGNCRRKEREDIYNSIIDLCQKNNLPLPSAYAKCHGNHPETYVSDPDAVGYTTELRTQAVMSKHKFVLAVEGKRGVDFLHSEKLINAFASGSIPIYSGPKTVFKIFRPESFIYLDIKNPQQALDTLMHLATDVNAYNAMRAEPMLQPGAIDTYFSFGADIGDGSLRSVIRKAVGIEISPTQDFLNSWVNVTGNTFINKKGQKLNDVDIEEPVTIILMGDSKERMLLEAIAKDEHFTCSQSIPNGLDIMKHDPTLVVNGPNDVHPLEFRKCVKRDIQVIHTVVSWGLEPYGMVHWDNPRIPGIDGLVDGLSNIRGFSDRLIHIWKTAFPDFNTLSQQVGKNILVVWDVNTWHVASMNVKHGGFFRPEQITPEYRKQLQKNATKTIEAFTKLFHNNNVKHVVQLVDETYTMRQTFMGVPQGQVEHIKAINNAWRKAAGKYLLYDTNLQTFEGYVRSRENIHPTDVVLRQWWYVYKHACNMEFRSTFKNKASLVLEVRKISPNHLIGGTGLAGNLYQIASVLLATTQNVYVDASIVHTSFGSIMCTQENPFNFMFKQHWPAKKVSIHSLHSRSIGGSPVNAFPYRAFIPDMETDQKKMELFRKRFRNNFHLTKYITDMFEKKWLSVQADECRVPLGVHIRSTDLKLLTSIDTNNEETTVRMIRHIHRLHPSIDCIFMASDSEYSIQHIEKAFKGELKVVYFAAFRETSNIDPKKMWITSDYDSVRPCHMRKKAEEAMMEIMFLRNATYFLREPTSAISKMAILFKSFKAVYSNRDLPIKYVKLTHTSRNAPINSGDSGLGNHMLQYASTLGIAHERNAIACGHLHPQLKTIFKGPWMKPCPSNVKFTHVVERGFGLYDENLVNDGANSISVGTYLQSWKYFKNINDEIRSIFTFKGKFSPDQWIRNYRKNSSTLVAVHLRFGRFNVAHSYIRLPPQTWYTKIYQRFGVKTTIMVFSDDLEKAMAYLPSPPSHINLIPSPNISPAHDMALMSECDEILSSRGTFSWWPIWFKGHGISYINEFDHTKTVVANKIKNDDYYLPTVIFPKHVDQYKQQILKNRLHRQKTFDDTYTGYDFDENPPYPCLDDIVIVSAITMDEKYIQRLKNVLLAALKANVKNTNVEIYVLGDYDENKVKNIGALYPFVKLIPFPYDIYSKAHLSNVRNYAWKALVVHHALKTNRCVFWLDSSQQVVNFKDMVRGLETHGYWFAGGPDWPFPAFKYDVDFLPFWNDSLENYRSLEKPHLINSPWGEAPPFYRTIIAPGYIGFHKYNTISNKISECWANCSLTKECIDPSIRSTHKGRYDQTVLQECLFGPGQIFEIPSISVSIFTGRNERVALWPERKNGLQFPFLHYNRAFWSYRGEPYSPYPLKNMVIRTCRGSKSCI